MNIFALSTDPNLAAIFLCNKHLAKMLLESCQLLSNYHPLPKYTSNLEQQFGPPNSYKPTHQHHPCSLWLSQSSTLCKLNNREFTYNQLWLLLHATAIYKEYSARYGQSKLAKALSKNPNTLERHVHKCAIPLQKLTYQVLEATKTANLNSLSLLLHEPTNSLPKFSCFAQAMPDQYKLAPNTHSTVVLAYRHYYKAEKQKFAKYNGRTYGTPEFMVGPHSP